MTTEANGPAPTPVPETAAAAQGYRFLTDEQMAARCQHHPVTWCLRQPEHRFHDRALNAFDHEYVAPAPSVEPVEALAERTDQRCPRFLQPGNPDSQRCTKRYGHGGDHSFAPPVEVKDEGARPLDELWCDYGDALLTLESASSAFIARRVREMEEARAEVERAIREEATAALELRIEGLLDSLEVAADEAVDEKDEAAKLNEALWKHHELSAETRPWEAPCPICNL